MPSYDKYIGQPWESKSTPLIAAAGSTPESFSFTSNSIFESFGDNDTAYIIPKYLRDAVLSIWDSVPFKETFASGSSIYYIGIDSGMGDDELVKPNRDLEMAKIMIGKRSFTGTNSYTDSSDIMTDQLSSTDIDVYLYNTRKDIWSQQSTRVSILASAEFDKHAGSPYIQSQVVSIPGGSKALSLDFISPNGSISILSRGKDIFGNDTIDGGEVYINSISFPTIGSSSAVPIDSKSLIYRDGSLSWEKIEFPQTDHIGITGSMLKIHGSPTNVNGFSIEFTDYRYVTSPIGDIQLGSTFESMSIADVLRKIVYPYLPPKCELSLSPGQSQYLEVGTYPIISLSYKITKRSKSLKPTKLINMIPSTYKSIEDPGQITISDFARGVVITPLMATVSVFTMKATDGYNYGIATASVSGIYPYFYGFTSSSTLSMQALSWMSKSVEPKSDKSYDVTGSGNLFFAYDYDYGPLSEILDPQNVNIIGSFSSTIKTISSPTGLWASKKYWVYQYSGMSQIGPPSENFEFRY